MRVAYVAGPYSAADEKAVLANVNRAIDVGNELIDLGLSPIVPHLTHYLHARKARDYEVWMTLDFALVNRSDALVRMPKASKGADREVAYAQEIGVRVFHWPADREEVRKWAKNG